MHENFDYTDITPEKYNENFSFPIGLFKSKNYFYTYMLKVPVTVSQ